VFHKDVGPLISMEEMSRCIHCTRCVRFGQEVAGVMELGMSHRGEHAEIETFVGHSVDSELSGNMIDICPVGALTSKPFRYSARTWELSRRKSVSPHDSTGANLVVQVKNNKVMRVVPLENEAVNECWIADRDRFSYEALNGPERLTKPMLKQGGAVAGGRLAGGARIRRQRPQADQGRPWRRKYRRPGQPAQHGRGAGLAGALVRGLGSENIDYRCATPSFAPQPAVRWLGLPIAALSRLQRVLVVGSNLRKDHPLFAQRIRQAVRHGCAGQPHRRGRPTGPCRWPHRAGRGRTGRRRWPMWRLPSRPKKALRRPCRQAGTRPRGVAAVLLGGERKAMLLGNAAAHHAKASSLLAWRTGSAQQTGARSVTSPRRPTPSARNCVGAMPGQGGQHAGQMLAGGLKAVLLLNTEPEFDSAAGAAAAKALGKRHGGHAEPVQGQPGHQRRAVADRAVHRDSGSFVNAEGRVQGFHAVVKPAGEPVRPGRCCACWPTCWACRLRLRVLAGRAGRWPVWPVRLDLVRQRTGWATRPAPRSTWRPPTGSPCVASIYQLDAHRAPRAGAATDRRCARRFRPWRQVLA
jgi:NADH-quinone oxidoreductase subunit G